MSGNEELVPPYSAPNHHPTRLYIHRSFIPVPPTTHSLPTLIPLESDQHLFPLQEKEDSPHLSSTTPPFKYSKQQLYRRRRRRRRSMEEAAVMPRVKLGTQGLEVSKLGFGCMGLTGLYNDPLSDDDGIAIIKEAYERGVTFFDTSDKYGPYTNEVLLGKALKHLPREKVQVATKFGIVKIDLNGAVVKGTPDYVRECCEGSLKRLDVDYIDLYFQHRVDTTVPIEDTMGELKKLVEEGKIKYIGLSEASPDTIRRAHAEHPITALQIEWSLWTRDVEDEIVPLCRELGIGIVSYSPLGRGFFAGKAVVENLPASSFLSTHPRFTGENLEKNKILYSRLNDLTAKHHCIPAQLALAWLLHQGDDVAPIPGTTKVKNLLDNIGAVMVKLTKEDLEELSHAVPLEEVAGGRTYAQIENITWRYANTPPKS